MSLLNESNNRKIIHIDMDAFFASVEQRNNPELKGKPIIVGGMPNSRGVVSTCSYEARKFGIHSAMPAYKAYKLCPKAIFIRPNFSLYMEASMQIRKIFKTYTEYIEPLSIDEAFLDVTNNKINERSATLIAKDILKTITLKTNLSASAGVSYNKFLAKIASDYKKPNGLTVITPDSAQIFIDKLPIGKFFGVGKVTEKKMHSLGINYGRDLKKYTLNGLKRIFGNSAEYYYLICRGIDNRPVQINRIRKSIGKENTFHKDLTSIAEMHKELLNLSDSLANSLNRHNKHGKTITLKVKFHDFDSITRSITSEISIQNSQNEIYQYAKLLLARTESNNKNVRLLGISMSNFIAKEASYIQPVFPFYLTIQ
ncbi:MAG: DNA polymerase IV [bacterium]|nr:DNA polymerase IV [bacterium]